MTEPETAGDGITDAKVGRDDCIEEVKTVIAEDGVEETQISYTIKKPDGSFAGWNKEKYTEIDWTK